MGVELGMGFHAFHFSHKRDNRRKHPVSPTLSKPIPLNSKGPEFIVRIAADQDRYTRLMATYNPSMLKDEPFGKDWKAAPDLTSFAASYAGTGAGVASGGGAYVASASTGSDAASVSNVGTSASAGAASAGNGAGMSIFSILTPSLWQHRRCRS